MSEEYPVKDPQVSIDEVKAFAKKNFGSFKKMERAAYRAWDEEALAALALHERATEAIEVMEENPDATYGDRHLADILKEDA